MSKSRNALLAVSLTTVLFSGPSSPESDMQVEAEESPNSTLERLQPLPEIEAPLNTTTTTEAQVVITEDEQLFQSISKLGKVCLDEHMAPKRDGTDELERLCTSFSDPFVEVKDDGDLLVTLYYGGEDGSEFYNWLFAAADKGRKQAFKRCLLAADAMKELIDVTLEPLQEEHGEFEVLASGGTTDCRRLSDEELAEG